MYVELIRNFSPNNILTVVAKNSSSACPKIFQNRHSKPGTSQQIQ